MFEVIVGNIGTVYAGDSATTAKESFEYYKKHGLSKTRAEDSVTLFEDGELEDEYFFDKYIAFNRGELCLPVQALEDCHHQGACDDDVAFWHGQIDWAAQTMTADDIRAELAEHGAGGYGVSWDDEELTNVEDNQKYILWIAAANYQEEQLSE